MSVIQFRRQKNEIGSDINSLLKMAVDIRENAQNKKETISNFKAFISGKIMETLINNRMIETGSIYCGMYISDLLGSLLGFTPEHWVAIDYLIEGGVNNNPFIIQRGADVCFLICSLFQKPPGRCMKLKNYRFIGISLFAQFYHQTGKEIGFYMSKQFSEMTEVTKECIKKL